MVIAINTALFSNLNAEDADTFIYECFSRITAFNPQHHFIFIFDKAFNKSLITGKNTTAVIVKQIPINTIARRYWYNYKLPAILKKHKVDILFNADPVCSLRTKIPQYNLITTLSWMAYPQFYKKSHAGFFKKMMPKFLYKTNSIMTVSVQLKKNIIDLYKVAADKITVLPAAANDNYKPVDWEEKEQLKEKYADGKEYFLYTGVIAASNNLMNMLKAFSHFKKWQKSNMQFVIAGNVAPGYEKFLSDLKLYKYRDDVKVIENFTQKELIELTVAAYAVVATTYVENTNIYVVQAMKAGIPVIVTRNTAAATFGDAVLAANPDDHKDIAEQMILLYKDELKRNTVITAGSNIVKTNDWDKTAALIWQTITGSIQNT